MSVPGGSGAVNEEPQFKSIRRPFGFGWYFLIFLLLAAVLLLGGHFYKVRLAQGSASDSVTNSLPAGAEVDNRGSVPSSSGQSVADSRGDGSSQIEVAEKASEPEQQQMGMSKFAAVEMAESLTLGATVALQREPELDINPYHDGALIEKMELTEEAMPGSSPQGLSMSLAQAELSSSVGADLSADRTENESIGEESVGIDVVGMDSVEIESVEVDSVEVEPVEVEPVEMDSVDMEPVDMEPVEVEPVDNKVTVDSVAAPGVGIADDDTAATGSPSEKYPPTNHLLHVEFGFDSARLSKESEVVLENALGLLNNTQNSTAKISGYSDSLGGQKYNLTLSRRRAETVARYLTEKGIQPTRLQVEGRGAVQVSANTIAQDLQPIYSEWRIVEIRINVPTAP